MLRHRQNNARLKPNITFSVAAESQKGSRNGLLIVEQATTYFFLEGGCIGSWKRIVVGLSSM